MLVAPGSTLIWNVRLGLDSDQLKRRIVKARQFRKKPLRFSIHNSFVRTATPAKPGMSGGNRFRMHPTTSVSPIKMATHNYYQRCQGDGAPQDKDQASPIPVVHSEAHRHRSVQSTKDEIRCSTDIAFRYSWIPKNHATNTSPLQIVRYVSTTTK